MATNSNDVDEKKISDLEHRIRKLETYWYVTLAVAAVLGIGGGWIQSRLGELESNSRVLLQSVDRAKASALSEIEEGRDKAIAETAARAEVLAVTRVEELVKQQIVAGETRVGGYNGNHGPGWLDANIAFTDSAGKTIEFENPPHVVAVAARGTTVRQHAWAVTVLGVTKQGFRVRVKSVDLSAERNPGWNQSVAVRWLAYAAD